MSFFAFQVRFEEDIAAFVPNRAEMKNVNAVFRNLKVKDKIIVLVSGDGIGRDTLIAVGDAFVSEFDKSSLRTTHVDRVLSKVDMDKMLKTSDFVYRNLPIFLDSAYYESLNLMLTPDSIEKKMQRNLETMISPSSLFAKNFIFKDPIGIGGMALSNLRSLRLDGDYEVYDEHVFSSDGKSLLIIIDPHFPAGDIGENTKLVKELDRIAAAVGMGVQGVCIDSFGGPVVSAYNSQQIRTDTWVTLSFAFLLIAVVILLSFRNKFSILLIFLPVAFGALFALSAIFFINGSISLIAVGAGSAILGVVLSYSIHVVAHREHTPDIETLIKEMSEPLTIGSFTTIGAFFSLTFTSSDVLRDFGLFASLTIVGTTLFCLIFLPHFLGRRSEQTSPNRFLSFIEKINSYHYEKNKSLVAVIIVAAVVGFFLSGEVQFNSDMNSLCYMPERLVWTSTRLDSIFQRDSKTIYFVSVGNDSCNVYDSYRKMNSKLDSMRSVGLVKGFACASGLVFSPEEQKRRIERWNDYWSDERISLLKTNLAASAHKCGFSDDAFVPFFDMLHHDYQQVDYSKSELFADWFTHEGGVDMAISKVSLKEEDKVEAYNCFAGNGNVVVLDKPFFASSFVQSLKDDFYFVRFVSSFIVFIALFVSYGRIELALLSFFPMALSWFIILGLMALLGIEFNIVNIIISTFIFGIGDDFSIFVTDGLISEYRTGKKMLSAHKVAIFFSAFTTIVGMGALAFARHPALQSVSVSSIIGMFAVLLIAYVIQPLIFDFFVTRRVRKGLFPWSFFSIFSTGLVLSLFGFFTLILSAMVSILSVLPINQDWVMRQIHGMVCALNRVVMKSAFHVEKVKRGDLNIEKPSIIIANHQSVVDIPLFLSLSPHLVMVTKDWVWKLPVIGVLIKKIGFINASEGIDSVRDIIAEKLSNGYSVLLFPEGKRSETGDLNRFHSGAFSLSEEFKTDIVPIVIAGNSDTIPKHDVMLSRSRVLINILPPIRYEDRSWGETAIERRRSISKFFREEYDKLMVERNSVHNPYFYNKLTRNFIYKGPVTEWYMRIKVKTENNYEVFDYLIPRNASITDIGCGYGFLPFMLSFVAKDRKVLGIDYDESKIAVAQNCFSRSENLSFISTDATTYDLPVSDVYIMNDMLHYLPYEKQDLLIERCLCRVPDSGFVIIRDGNSEVSSKHEVTKATEVMSTKVLMFNKTNGQLYFTSRKRIETLASKCGFSVECFENDQYTSNTIYILKRKH